MNVRVLVVSILIALAQSTSFAEESRSTRLEREVAEMMRVGSAFSPTFSPDGSQIAFVSDLNGIPQVWIVSSAGGFPRLVTGGVDPVTSVRWSPKDVNSLAVLVAPGGGMNAQVYVVRPDGTHMQRLTAGGKDNNTLFDWTHDGRRVMIGSSQRDPAAVDPYIVDPVTRKMDRIQEAGGVSVLEEVSTDGRFGIVSRKLNRGDNNLYLIDTKSGKQTLLTPHEGHGRFSGQFGPNSNTIYLSSDKNRDLIAFGRLNVLPDGTVSPISIISSRSNAELEQFKLNEQKTRAALVWNVSGQNELDFVDLATGKTTRGPTLPAEMIRGLTFSADGRQLALALTGPQAPSDIWVMNLETGKLRQVTVTPHAGISLSQLTRPELVTFKAHDGVQLSGWLYEPKGRRGAIPFVLIFHGGPEGEERPSFHSEYQALLSQGIGVFAPNVRGSSGFGSRFENLDNGPLRVNSVKDIKASADYLTSSGRADPARLGIAGGSYGGYMTMAGVTEFPDLFAAGVNLFGIVNFATFFAQTEPWMASVSMVKYGDPVRDAEMLKSLSPIHKLDRIKAALMVQHGANDTNVPVIEAEQIVASLRARNVPVEYVLFPDEGHGFRKTGNRIRSIVSMTEFFVKVLNPSPVADSE